ncbi:hypothetical protein LAZ67_10002458 [Cordylochernes scorpioides]|uniref:Uncharacterized protein n=1 Tax=Cordylochernes scorpioides TaxID=51811 RepID=A0ABY6L0H9_9ARAC|nr:hypothetical protein LAZ67_10002458 [Cordylochernes scorpioides]
MVGCQGVAYYELLPPNQPITSDKSFRIQIYGEYMERIWLYGLLTKLKLVAYKPKLPKLAIRRGIVFPYDNARPHNFICFDHYQIPRVEWNPTFSRQSKSSLMTSSLTNQESFTIREFSNFPIDSIEQ